MARPAIALAAVTLLGAACGGGARDLSLGQALVVVDTDMPVPAHVARLRIDLYTAEGRWYESRDVEGSRPEAWPVSFGAFVAEGELEKVVLIRLRAYPEGGVRDYRGERFAPRLVRADTADELLEQPLPAPDGRPRLLESASNVDLTPATEPQPLLTIDRLVRVRVRQHERGAVRVLLRGECMGMRADLVGQRSCVDREGALVPVVDEQATEGLSFEPRSAVGTFDPKPACTESPRRPSILADGTPLHEEEVCLPGAMFRFGSRDGLFGRWEDLPERVAIIEPLRFDRFEVSVARWRSAVAEGFQSPDETPITNDGPLDSKNPDFRAPKACTWSSAPQGRETLPLACVSWAAARAFCSFRGGDLPSEAEWEHAAAVAGRPARTMFVWGSAFPDCARAVFGRSTLTSTTKVCTAEGFGPVPVDARSGEDADRTPTFGIVGLGGGVIEWTRDAAAPMTATCWAASGLRSPGCDVTSATEHSIRGSGWTDNAPSLVLANRRGEGTWSASVGFRCVRRGAQ